MLYHLDDIDYRDDPYGLDALADCQPDNQSEEDYFREPNKRMLLALINGREGKHNERIKMPNKQTYQPHFSRTEIVEMLKAKHAPIARRFFTEVGIELQRLESDIALGIITNLKAKGIVCLPIHDSFIVAREYEDELRFEMKNVYKSKFIYDPVIKKSE